MSKTYSKKVKGLDLTPYTEVEIYQLLLEGTLKRFPNNFLDCDEVKSYAPKITKYLLEERLKWSKEDIKEKLNIKTFKKNRLGSFVSCIYGGSPHKALEDAYGEDYIKPWELSFAPLNFWSGKNGLENGFKATKWLFEEKLKWTKEDILNKLNQSVFIENGLSGMLSQCYEGSMHKCIQSVYPDVFKPWEIGSQIIFNYWNEVTSTMTVKWLIEDKLKWSIEDIKRNLDSNTFIDNNLGGLLKHFNDSPYKAINSTYPDIIKPWELNKVPNSYWNEETSKIAMKWFIEDVLNWGMDDIKENLSQQIFKDYNLVGLLNYFNSSPFEAINSIYPGKIKPWELKSVPNNYWNEDTSKLAMKWLIEEELNWSIEDVKKKLDIHIFRKYRLTGMLLATFNNSPYNAINHLYPGEIKPWELNKVPRSYWNEETIKLAVNWLVYEKLKWSKEEVDERLTQKILKENNLCSITKRLSMQEIKDLIG